MSNKTYHLKNQEKLQKFIEEQKKKNDSQSNKGKNTNNSTRTRTN